MHPHSFTLRLGIRAKLGLLSVFFVLLTLIITLSISSYREVESKKAEARKLMINLGKQIGLLKSMEETLPKNIISDYLDKTIQSNLSRKGYSIAIVYLITTDHAGRLKHSSFNWNMIKISENQAEMLARKILENDRKNTPFLPGPGIQNVKVELREKEALYLGFSMQLIQSEILAAILENLFIGFLLICLAIIGALILAKKITGPLFRLIEGIEKVSKGDFNVKVLISTGDEIEQLSHSFNQMTLGLQERETIKDIFRRYASDQVVGKILEGKVKPTLSGELKTVTVLFSDIRMFTAMSSKLTPEKTVYLLNRYFTAMTDVVISNEGFIDKFTGDEMMVVFGAPIEQPDHIEKAVKTALQMLEKLESVNETLQKEGCPKIEIGIGINSGEAIAGNIGSEKRMAYTVIGQDVNLASRLVSIAGKGEIILSQAAFHKVKHMIQAQEEIVTLKGVEQSLTIYRYKK